MPKLLKKKVVSLIVGACLAQGNAAYPYYQMNPAAAADVVGRDLNISGLGWVGHVGLWTGSYIIEVLTGFGSQSVRTNTIDNFRVQSTYWGSAYVPADMQSVAWLDCTSSSCNVMINYTLQMAVVQRAVRVQQIGANYTIGNEYYRAREACPATYPWCNPRDTLPIRGMYRCDTFLLDTFDQPMSGTRSSEEYWRNWWYGTPFTQFPATYVSWRDAVVASAPTQLPNNFFARFTERLPNPNFPPICRTNPRYCLLSDPSAISARQCRNPRMKVLFGFAVLACIVFLAFTLPRSGGFAQIGSVMLPLSLDHSPFHTRVVPTSSSRKTPVVTQARSADVQGSALLTQRSEGIRRIKGDTKLSDEEKLDAIWALYREQRNDPVWASFYVDSMYIFLTSANARKLVSLVQGEVRDTKLDDSVRVSLIGLLGRVFHEGRRLSNPDEQDWNTEIVATLRDIASSGSRTLGGAAIMEYVRLGYFDDSVSLLEAAKNAQTIGPEAYVREMLLQVPGLTEARRTEAIGAVVASGLPSLEISKAVVDTIAISPDFVSRLNPSAKKDFADLLMKYEPGFSSYDTYDVLEAVKYVDWLSARAALLGASSSPESLTRYMSDAVLTARDPRKLAAISTSGYGQVVIDEIVRTGRAEDLVRRLADYQAHLPPGAPVGPILNELRAMLEARIRKG